MAEHTREMRKRPKRRAEIDPADLLPKVRVLRKHVVELAEDRAQAVAMVTTVLAGLLTDGISTPEREEYLAKTTQLLRNLWARFDAAQPPVM